MAEPTHKAEGAPSGSQDIYPGLRLGLPAGGPGALAGWGTRIAGLLVDWALTLLLARLIFGAGSLQGRTFAASLLPSVVFFVHTTLMLTLTGSTIGQLVGRIGVARLDGRPLGLVRAVARQLLVCLVLPALVLDGQRRGLQDLAAGTVVVLRRRA